jgi:Pentapeptide repeats (8 copies)/YHYH protein
MTNASHRHGDSPGSHSHLGSRPDGDHNHGDHNHGDHNHGNHNHGDHNHGNHNHGDHNHDGHHQGPIGPPHEVNRRQALYFLSSGILAAAFLPAGVVEAATKKRVTTRSKKRSASTKVVTTSVSPSTTITKRVSASGIDPWTLYPKTVRASRTTTELIVESTGLPEHSMMIGITSWQQQVPLPQPYSGTNAWTIPLRGVLSDNPISTKNSLFRGAIALAINGVPIFNALNNRREDSFLIGELDQWGGHCGRADDYHYHAAPLHLGVRSGPSTPIAVALDGFPIYGLSEPDGSPVRALDAFNGHEDSNDTYHYHATLTYPYINGGMRGRVQVVGDQVDPQPTAAPVRPAGQPLRGATITSFAATGNNAYLLEYTLSNAKYSIHYELTSGNYLFQFTDPAGIVRTETYPARTR